MTSVIISNNFIQGWSVVLSWHLKMPSKISKTIWAAHILLIFLDNLSRSGYFLHPVMGLCQGSMSAPSVPSDRRNSCPVSTTRYHAWAAFWAHPPLSCSSRSSGYDAGPWRPGGGRRHALQRENAATTRNWLGNENWVASSLCNGTHAYFILLNTKRVLFENRPALYFCNYIFITAHKLYNFGFRIKDTVLIFLLPIIIIMILIMKILLHNEYKIINLWYPTYVYQFFSFPYRFNYKNRVLACFQTRPHKNAFRQFLGALYILKRNWSRNADEK